MLIFHLGGGIKWPSFEQEEEGGKDGWMMQLDAGNIMVVPRDRKKECSTSMYSNSFGN